jgi:two-component system sensor histidine kinase QseC
MTAKLPASLQGRLIVLVLGVVTIVWACAAAVIWIDAREELDELFDGHLAQAAALLVARSAHEFEDDDAPVDTPLLHRYAPKAAFQVWHEGRLAMRSSNAPAVPMSSKRSGFATLPIDGRPWRVFATRGHERDIQVYVGEQLGSRQSVLYAIVRGMLVPMLIALPLLALAGWIAVRAGIAPLRRLSATLAQRAPHALEPVTYSGASELAPLVTALNGLLKRIGALLESERRFTADAAHELRTPIAAIRAQAQVAAAATDDAERRHALAATLSGCERAARLVDQLLMLARLEAGPEGSMRQVDLSALTRQVLADQAAHAVAQGQQLELDAPATAVVHGEEILLAVLVRNLVDNAIRYSGRASRVHVSVAQQGEETVLVVEDSGPGMGEEQRARLGERFFRSGSSEATGSGLGWSIIKRIVAAHGARLDVGRSPELGGLRVAVSWPAAQKRARIAPPS